jgi:xanthine dehydrogenase accessory factor
VDEVIANGVDAAAVGRVRSPAGIDIGAATPEEIALSVLADIVRERRQGSLAEAPRIEDVLEEISGEAPSLS